MSGNLIPLTNLPASNGGGGNPAAPPPDKKFPKPKSTAKPKAKKFKISAKQLAANRANAQKSTGPRTAQGKDRIRFNSLKHGLTGGHLTVLHHESLGDYEAFRRTYIQALNPGSPIEYSMASNLADLQYRLSRVPPFENNLLSVVLDEFEQGSLSDSSVEDGFRMAEAYSYIEKSMLNLSLYETRLGRRFSRLMEEFKAQQRARDSAKKASLVTASHHANLAQEKNLDYDPQPDGFAFSKNLLDRFSHRRAVSAWGSIAEQWRDYALNLQFAGAFNTGKLRPWI